ncbi:uncharacterized protein [Amphiura filiformis]|uniref:uncharacterized protein n=1 Tax=Amphiura filiformis TaxID=82378 RepID=UPI003B222A40
MSTTRYPMDPSPQDDQIGSHLNKMTNDNPPASLASSIPLPIGRRNIQLQDNNGNIVVPNYLVTPSEASSTVGSQLNQDASNSREGHLHVCKTPVVPSAPTASGFDQSPVASSPVWVRSNVDTNDSVRTSATGTQTVHTTPASSLPVANSAAASALPTSPAVVSGLPNEYPVVPTANCVLPTSPAVVSGLNSQYAPAPLATLSEMRHIDDSPSPPASVTGSTRSGSLHSDDCPDRRRRARISLQHLFDIEASVAAVASRCDANTGDGMGADDGQNIGFINPMTVFVDEMEGKSEAQSLISYDVSPWKPGCRGCSGAYPSPSATSFSTISSEGPICRICHEGEQGGHLISPCRCTGTLRYLHKKCLEQWLQTRNKDICELCNTEICTRRKTQPFSEWFRHPLNPRDRRNFAVDFACSLVLTPLVVISAWLCLNGSAHYMRHADRSLEGLGLILLAAVLIVIFSAWSLLTARYHFMVWREWSKHNQLVTVLVSPQPSPATTINSQPNKTSEQPASDGNYSRVSSSVTNSGNHIAIAI